MEQLGVSVMGQVETQKLIDEWPLAMYSLRRDMAKLRLLFRDIDIAAILKSFKELNSSFTDMYHGEQLDRPELHQVIAENAAFATQCVIDVGQRYCLSNNVISPISLIQKIRTWYYSSKKEERV